MENNLKEVGKVCLDESFETLKKIENLWEQTHQNLNKTQIKNMRMKDILGKMLSHYQRHGELEHSAVVLDFMPQVLNVLSEYDE